MIRTSTSTKRRRKNCGIGATWILPAVIQVFWSMTASAQPVSDDELSSLSLEELLRLRVSVASKTAESTRESPGIISIITREEILNTGATDLVDILQQVPGFALGVDVSNVVSPGIRGNWAATGKVLVLLDGLQLNEEMFGSFP
jgi:outer membrane receptor for ferrienterochelin and colicin